MSMAGDGEGRWFVARSGKVRGPFDRGTIQQLLQAGQLRVDDRVAREGSDEWHVLASVDELAPQGSRSAVELTATARYYAQSDSGTLGPFDVSGIVAAVRNGRLEVDCRVCLLGDKTWRRLDEFDELRQAVAPPEASKPAPPMPATSELHSNRASPPPPHQISHVTHPAPSSRQPRVWSPQPVIFAGLLFTPIWSSVLLSMNWRAMGDERRARLAALPGAFVVLWIVTSCCISIVASEGIASLAEACGLPVSLLALGWLELSHALPQKKLLAGIAHESRSWLAPLLIGVSVASMLCGQNGFGA